MKKRLMAGLLLVAVGALALMAAGCGGSNKSSSSTGGGGTSAGVKALPAANCNPIQYKGSGDADYLIASDLPLIGSSRTADRADEPGDRLRAAAAGLEGR